MKRAVAAVVLAGCGGVGAPAQVEPSCSGALWAGSQEQLIEIGRCARVDGELSIRSGAALDLAALAGVEEITGDLVIGPSIDISTVNLEGLRQVGGALRVISNGAATGVFLPRLEGAGLLEISANTVLSSISAPALREVAGDLLLESNPELEVVDATALGVVGRTLRVRGNPKLMVLDASALGRAGAVELEGHALSDGVAEALRATSQP